MSGFYGRSDEIRRLREANWRGHAELVVVYGRRRVGKTALVEHAYRADVVWKLDGLEGASKRAQLVHFTAQLAVYTDRPQLKQRPPEDWETAFELLADLLETWRTSNGDRSLVLFLDEFQWMARMRSPLVALFKSYWDTRISQDRHLRVVLCGSVSSFMVKKVLRSKALYGRVSTEINLQPLELTDAYEFFDRRRDHQQVLEIAMTLGCIPQYLEELNPKLSLAQNLNEYAFSPHGFFFGEYQRLFISHFGKNPVYEKVLHRLSTGPQTADQLAKHCRTKTGGSFTNILSDLVLAGFIERYSPLGAGPRSRLVRYRIQDEYLHFYFRFIQRHQQAILSGRFSQIQLLQDPGYQQWQGYAFERLCRRHAARIADHLRFSGIRYETGSWFQSAAQPPRGAQVDLLFARADRVLTVCEAKYRKKLDADSVASDLAARCEALRVRFPGHGIQTVLLLGQSIEIPDRLRAAFDEVIDASEALFGQG